MIEFLNEFLTYNILLATLCVIVLLGLSAGFNDKTLQRLIIFQKILLGIVVVCKSICLFS